MMILQNFHKVCRILLTMKTNVAGLLSMINPPYTESDARTGRGRKDIQVSKTHDILQTVFSTP
jgi:hypothetical protein